LRDGDAGSVGECGEARITRIPMPRHPGARSAAQPAGTQTSGIAKAIAALEPTRVAPALINAPPVDWVPAFAGMTLVGMRARSAERRAPLPLPLAARGRGGGARVRGGARRVAGSTTDGARGPPLNPPRRGGWDQSGGRIGGLRFRLTHTRRHYGSASPEGRLLIALLIS
jgi:hypothetical protein